MKLHRVPAIGLLVPVTLLSLSGVASAQWTGDGPILTNDNVGIGVPYSSHRLHVSSGTSAPAALIESAGLYGAALIGKSYANGGAGLLGVAASPIGDTVGVKGHVESANGKAIWGYVDATGGQNYAIYGQTRSRDGYAGYFTGGKFYAGGGFAGIGRKWQVNSTEAFGIYADTTSWGGMYVSTNGGGLPYYGYAVGGLAQAYHFFEPVSDQWRLVCGSTRMAVNQSNGRVGIKTVTPSYQLHVNGSAGKPGGGSWSNASDLRLKKDVEPIDGALDRLLSLRGVSYEYRDPESIHELEGRQLGVIAQEVEAAFPGWVDEGDDGFKRVTFRGFEGVTIEALRELRDENERLRDDLSALSARLEALEESVRR